MSNAPCELFRCRGESWLPLDFCAVAGTVALGEPPTEPGRANRGVVAPDVSLALRAPVPGDRPVVSESQAGAIRWDSRRLALGHRAAHVDIDGFPRRMVAHSRLGPMPPSAAGVGERWITPDFFW